MMWCCYATWIYPQVVRSCKCFNGEVNSHARYSMQNNPARMEKHKKLYGIFQLTTEKVAFSDTKWRRTYHQVMTPITSFWISTVAPFFSSASTTYSWPFWDAYIIAVQPFWSGMTIGAHWDEEHELTPTGSQAVAHCFTEMCTSEPSLLFSQSNC